MFIQIHMIHTYIHTVYVLKINQCLGEFIPKNAIFIPTTLMVIARAIKFCYKYVLILHAVSIYQVSAPVKR